MKKFILILVVLMMVFNSLEPGFIYGYSPQTVQNKDLEVFEKDVKKKFFDKTKLKTLNELREDFPGKQLYSGSTQAYGFLPNLGQLQDKGIKFRYNDSNSYVYFGVDGIEFDSNLIKENSQNVSEKDIKNVLNNNGVDSKMLFSGEKLVQYFVDKKSVKGYYDDNPELNRHLSELFQKTEKFNYKIKYIGANLDNLSGTRILTHKTAVMNFDEKNNISSFSGLQNYENIKYTQIYDGIDLVFKSTKQGIKNEFIVSAGANPDLIRTYYDGIEKLYIDKDGNLVLKNGDQTSVEKAPYSYQIKDGYVYEIESKYKILDNNTVGFELGDYDKNIELIIDPLVMQYNKLIYQNRANLQNMLVDKQGNSYILLVGNPSTTLRKYDKNGQLILESIMSCGNNNCRANNMIFDKDGNIIFDFKNQVINGATSIIYTNIVKIDSNLKTLDAIGLNASIYSYKYSKNYNIVDMDVDSNNKLVYIVNFVDAKYSEYENSSIITSSIYRWESTNYSRLLVQYIGTTSNKAGKYDNKYNYISGLLIKEGKTYFNLDIFSDSNLGGENLYSRSAKIYSLDQTNSQSLLFDSAISNSGRNCSIGDFLVDKIGNLYFLGYCNNNFPKYSNDYLYIGMIDPMGKISFKTSKETNNYYGENITNTRYNFSNMNIDGQLNLYYVEEKYVSTYSSNNNVSSNTKSIKKIDSKNQVTLVYEKTGSSYSNQAQYENTNYNIGGILIDNNGNLISSVLNNYSTNRNGNSYSSNYLYLLVIDKNNLAQTHYLDDGMLWGYRHLYPRNNIGIDGEGSIYKVSQSPYNSYIYLNKIYDTNVFKLIGGNILNLKQSFDENEIVLEFSKNVAVNTVSNIKLFDESNNLVPVIYSINSNIVKLKFKSSLIGGKKYFLSILTKLKDVNGVGFVSEFGSSFVYAIPGATRINQDVERKNSMIYDDKEKNLPIDIRLGKMKFVKNIDKYPGEVMPFQFDLIYNGASNVDTILGRGFSHNYNYRLEVVGETRVKLYNPDLSYEYFLFQNGLFISENGSTKRLVHEKELGIYKLFIDGKRYLFNSKGWLINIIDDSENYLRFDYDIDGKLLQIIDTNNDTFILSYSTGGILDNVLRSDGNKIKFTYENGFLRSYRNEKRPDGSYGLGMSFNYSGFNISSIENENGDEIWNVTYGTGNRISQLKDADGNINGFSYAFLADGINVDNVIRTDGYGIKTYYKFDVKGNLLQKWLNYGSTPVYKYIYTYHPNGLIKSIRLPRGNGYVFSYDENGNVIQKRFKTSISSQDNDQVDIVENYVYEPIGNRIYKYISPLGFGTVYNINYLETNLELISQKYSINIDELKTKLASRGIIFNTSGGGGPNLKLKEEKVFGENGAYKYSKNSYLYNANGTIFSHSSNGSFMNVYYYDNKGRIISKQVGPYFYYYYQYDQRGNLEKVSAKNVESNLETFSQLNLYNGFGQRVLEKTAQGVTRKYFFNALGLPMRECFARFNGGDELDENNYICEEYTIENQYFPSGKLKSNTKNYSKGNFKQIVTNYQYDQRGNLISQIRSDGSTIIYKYDAFNNLISKDDNGLSYNYKYDANGNQIQIVDFRKRSDLYKYNLFDKLEKHTNPEGVYTNIFYDKNLRIISTQIYSKDGILVDRTDNEYDGYDVSKKIRFDVKDQNNKLTTSFEYNNGLLVKKIDEKGGVESYGYDQYGNRSSVVESSKNRRTQYTFLGKDILSKKENFDGDNLIAITEYKYDNDFRLIQESFTDLRSSKVSITKTEYNSYNQVLRIWDPKNISTDFGYDINGKILTKQINGKDASGNDLKKIERFEYDLDGNIISYTDGVGNKTLLGYDKHGRLINKKYQDESQVSISYNDTAGKKVTILEDGIILEEYFDKMDRLSKRIIKTPGVKTSFLETYSYDSIGRLITGLNYDTVVGFDYDGYGELKSETQTIKSKNSTYTISYENNLLNKKIVYPSGKQVVYNYDNGSKLQSVMFEGEKILENSYVGFLPISSTYSNNIVTSFEYDGYLKLTKIAIGDKGVITNEYDLSGFKSKNYYGNVGKNYGYDDFGRLEKIYYISGGETFKTQSNYFDLGSNRKRFEEKKLINGNLETMLDSYYEINNLNQYFSVLNNIVDESNKYGLNEYKQQTVGEKNSKQSQVVENTVEFVGLKGSGQQISKSNLQDYKQTDVPVSKSNSLTQNYSYDKRGNLVSDGKNNYKFDYANRLVQRNSESIIYDVLGRRLAVGNTIFVVNKNDQVLEERGDGVKIFVWGKKQDDLIMMEKDGGNRIFYHQDDQGSIVMLTDQNQNVIGEYLYDANGIVFEKKLDGNIEKMIYNQDTLNPYYYQGKRFEGDLYYRQARYYSPDLGRFISRDPLGIVDDINLYVFLKNNSSTYTDSKGEYVETPWDAIWVMCDGVVLTNNTLNVVSDSIIYGIGVITSDKNLRNEAVNMLDQDFEERSEIMGNLGFDGLAFMVPGLVAGSNRGFKSFKDLKQNLGGAGLFKAWHHIVEQHADNVLKFGAEKIHSVENVVKLPHFFPGSIHRKITGYYNSVRYFDGIGVKKVRDVVKTWNYEKQYEFGKKVIEKFGGGKYLK